MGSHMQVSEENAIPTVDVSALLSSTSSEAERRQVVDNVCHASRKYGFFNLVGHGIPPQQMKQALEINRRFFALPEEKRLDVHVSKAMGRSFRGWEPPLIQQHQDGLLPDTKETFIVGREVPADDSEAGSFMTGPNLWPDLPKDEFQNVVLDYQARMIEVAGLLIRILVQGLPKEWSCSPDALDGLLVDPAIPMRFLHYGPVPEKDPRQFGGEYDDFHSLAFFGIVLLGTGRKLIQFDVKVAAHTDFSVITILLQQPGTEGLQVWYPPTEDWIPVPVVEDGFVINIGDLMQKYTAGYYRSARHRVVTFSEEGKHRYSIAFFLDGNLHFKTRPLDGSGDEIEVGEYVRSCLMKTLGTRGPLL
ncbi:hypothetical protein N0V82_007291 [Gnomoniopsis sp. IMI 355080]|nr:hypothetical protein N0V82_007291 [Gnomoniopsis sp. IMI 355080]